ncbi:helicase-exonuclease AddAB subunit AddA [Paenibacillus allorhizosphaerae]|uniref:ATP-dependent helicase/nuclease subunit A n=1 Tax=Paenibacillus allorhizosphaerae TaxID=2849866 RepID=A0ABN7TKZ3_9BACL|nr:helicase-exonuclease AddAB subunit AddA [Paenibacillus allorhizosphaerae]CAG7634491.1 ATP-dependent helicase/nuclease subunit A [Paenibacillus allorhizosphaerae]
MIDKIPKPEGSTWTDDQWDAIAIRGHSMLVAAAAGSGKTAVLVERIIRRISDERDPLDVDRLLVATFTKAAAAEMRHRISEALEKALAANPGSDHLQRQLALIQRASITTLHSFCMEVIQRHYQLIGLDPGFRIANETESALMRQDLLEELLEERYGAAEEGDAFWRLADTFSGDKNDDALFGLIQRLYDDSRSHPWPDHWLRQSAAMFEREVAGDNPWVPSLLTSARLELLGAAALLREALSITGQPGGPVPYEATLRDDLAFVESLLEVSDSHGWEPLYDAFQRAAFGKLKPCKGDQYDKALQEQTKELRNEAKDRVAALREELFGRTPEQFNAELKAMAPLMQTLSELVIDFGERYRQAKIAKRLVDFADLEHYCLRILCAEESGPGQLVPSPAALEYQEQYAEVLLDEYQDTNRVQEAIVELISRPVPGNRFMVGDVKQSIYRFRLAEPGLFQEKYKSYRANGTDPGQRIDLARNFRSRRQVVDGTNYIFRQIMQETVGEIAYDDRAKLVYGAGYPEPEQDVAAELVLIDRSAEGSAESRDTEFEDTGSAGLEDEGGAGADETAADARELQTVQLEARYIAQQIRAMTGMDGGRPLQVFDKSAGGMRDAVYRDIVILLRATQQWAPVLIEELQLQGIPAYAELNSGYFTATEVQVLLSLLKVIDNPYQDIPLVSVLRSPIVGLQAEELAHIRINSKHGAYYDAVRAYARDVGSEAVQARGIEDKDVPLFAAMEGKNPEQIAMEQEAAATLTEDTSTVVPSNTVSSRDGMEKLETAAEARSQAADGLVGEQLPKHPDLQKKLNLFLAQLKEWRREAQQTSLADLIWDIYRVTGYFDYVGGLAGGQQRQANLRALYDRAKQYEATSFRGLFRFLRFVARMQESGGDLGTARALGEQEDVVRIMTIHKSKGLEFPVVFVAGMAKQFNRRDLADSFMLHKELGFGPKYMELETRVSYPTLPWLAIKRKIQLEMLAEEMRVLYVALTRAREKLVLVATVKGAEKLAASWSRFLSHESEALPDDAVANARCYLDWVGPALIRHPDGQPLREAGGLEYRSQPFLFGETSEWRVRLLQPDMFAGMTQAAVSSAPVDGDRWASLFRLEPVDGSVQTEHEVWRRLSWNYAHPDATTVLSKTSVTELKRLSEHHRLMELLSDEPEPLLLPGISGAPAADSTMFPVKTEPQSGGFRPVIVRRPRFLEQQNMNAAERGSVFHAVMQHIPLESEPGEPEIQRTLASMVDRELLTEAQRALVDPKGIAAFFQSALGQRMLRTKRVHREVPFSFGLPARDVYGADQGGLSDEVVMLQGVIDCLIEEEEGLVLLDYKTDRLKGGSPAKVAEGYRLQLDLYGKAVERIWKRPVLHKFIFLFDGAHVVEL